MKKTLFAGAGVAIVTPFNQSDGKINFGLLGELIDYQIASGTDAIIICGTTGEGSTLTHEEHTAAIQFAVEHTAGRVPVIAGTGSNDTAYAVYLSQEAESLGVDALLLVTPYYNKTSQEGLLRHYTYIADQVHTPMILYNVPSRTGVNILPETYQAMAKHPNITAIKEANGNIAALAQTMSLCGKDLDVYSGNDDQITPFLSLGAKGVISVMSNVAPRATHEIVAKYLDGDCRGSCELQLHYMELCRSLFMDVNPIPVKEAMELMGWEVGACRLPLVRMNAEKHVILARVIEKYALKK